MRARGRLDEDDDGDDCKTKLWAQYYAMSRADGIGSVEHAVILEYFIDNIMMWINIYCSYLVSCIIGTYNNNHHHDYHYCVVVYKQPPPPPTGL